MVGEKDIQDKLAKLETLFARGATAGERAAAGAARDRLQAWIDIERGGEGEAETELQYSLPDVWSVRIFVALCRKHDIKPYRYPRQRRTTVMVRVNQSTFESTVGEEFRILHRELTTYFGDMVDHLIADVMKSDGDDETLEQRKLSR
ncbi:hypothetical protein [Pseudosulfitobacter sp. DSM 107133]|uniref:hypothetical protein n=1 Tax=Pseudosulfitobacter sp. DSM 107133 TaxID=2883100 RepID=UPI000DF45AC4|nr:hypothetical protein [Pseudosulfitobacter sp. DSM 107133]UOA26047.1 hypothetical protein DSM107133_00738 [Pseudosulfitobacter sp. DSM 107133]